MKCLLTVALASLVAGLATAPAAPAETLNYSPRKQVLKLSAGPGSPLGPEQSRIKVAVRETEQLGYPGLHLVIEEGPTEIQLKRSAHLICARVPEDRAVVCVSQAIARLDLSLGAGDDLLDLSGIPATEGFSVLARGGAGRDLMRGGGAADDLRGDSGEDELSTGGEGPRDLLSGGKGNDFLTVINAASVSAAAGDDVVFLEDGAIGASEVRCGRGYDFLMTRPTSGLDIGALAAYPGCEALAHLNP